jgi:hypothetical protein
MNMRRTNRAHTGIRLSLTAAVLAGLCVVQSVRADEGPSRGLQHSLNPILAGFENIYWRWVYEGLTLPTDRNSNAVVFGVALMPVPAAPGDGTPATQEVTLSAGQPWMLPLWTLFGTSYNDGTPPDPFVDVSVFQTLEITFQIDGRTVIDSRNAMHYYSQFPFRPPIPLTGADPINAIIWFEGIGLLQGPLSPGKHTLTLHAKNTQPAFGGIFEYNNTWNVTVQRHR